MNIDFIGSPNEFIGLISSLSIIGISLATVIGFLGRYWWTFDLFSHFRLQYLFLLTGFTVLTLLFGRQEISIIGLSFVLINLITIVPYYFPTHKSIPKNGVYRILLSNVLQSNQEFDKLLHVIDETKPDIIVLIETDDVWMRELSSVSGKYDHKHIAIRRDNHGMAIFSRYAFDETQILYFSDANVPSLLVEITLDGNPLTLIGTHPPPPLSKIGNSYRNQQIMRIVDFIAHRDKPIILLGDLNITSWSPHFKQLIKGSNLHDSRKGFGIQPTWPTHNPLFMVPIDHVLVSDGVSIHNRFTGSGIGSDHRPVIVDFSIQ